MLWSWYREVMGGAIKRADVTVAVASTDGRDKKKLEWTFSEACPVKWAGPELHAGTSAVAFESIELVHKGLLEQKP
jgi:phage tail-like protein